jgi:hypothetical protein
LTCYRSTRVATACGIAARSAEAIGKGFLLVIPPVGPNPPRVRSRDSARRSPIAPLWFLPLVWVCLMPSVRFSAQRPPLEYEVKAAFLLNFVRFVQWPEVRSPGPIAVCVLRHNPFGDVLRQIVDGETVEGRPVVVRHISTPDAAPGCQILFVPRSVIQEDGAIAVPVEPGVLTVGESDTFIDLGGIINFFEDGGRIRFAIAPSAAQRSALRLSARLLNVARLVEPRRPR